MFKFYDKRTNKMIISETGEEFDTNYIVTPGGNLLGSLLFYLAGIKSSHVKKVCAGKLTQYRYSQFHLFSDRKETAPVVVWELRDRADMNNYKGFAQLNNLKCRKVLVDKYECLVYYRDK